MKWLENAVSLLVEYNHSFEQIQEYTLPQFIIMLRAAERRDAEKRSHFLTDLSVSLGGLLGGGEGLTKHLSSLTAFINEERKDGGVVK